MSHLSPRATQFSLLAVLAVLAGCVPDLDDDTSLVSGTRVLAIVADPPEAGEGDAVSLTALVASDGAAGEPSDGDVSYFSCLERKPLSELGPVAPACLEGDSAARVPLGRGRVEAAIDRSACSQFGPRRPSAEPGQPAGRAADPDSTGGFYQPVTAELPGQLAVLGGVRLDCGLASAERTQVILYNQRHRINENPRVERLESEEAGAWTAIEANAPRPVQGGVRLVLRASWTECAGEVRCTGAEPFVMYDAEAEGLVDRTEIVVASWYATAGSFDEHRTGATGDAPNQASNTWLAPLGPADVGMWVVLRDGRGGVGYAAYRFAVE